MQVAPHAPHQEQTAPGPDSCNLHKMYTWPARYDSVPMPPWNKTPAVTVEAGPNGKAEKADKVPYVRGMDFTQKCGEITYEGHMRTLMVADDMVDAIMTHLQNSGQLANTMVLFTTDNGYSWDERGLTSKGLPWTEHIQAPLMVRWDGVFPPGTTDDRLVGTEDYLPTYLDAAGYAPPDVHYPLDGLSLLPGRPARNEKLLEFGPILRNSPKGYIGSTDQFQAQTESFGSAFFTTSAELGLRVSSQLYLSSFFDAGNLWAHARDFNPTRLFRGAGFGAALVTPLGPLGLDMGYGFDRVDAAGIRKPAWQVHFKFGQFF